MAQQVHSYNPVTGAYIGSKNADRHPEGYSETYIVPANATLIDPPNAGNNKVAIFNVGFQSWSVVDDKTKETWYDPNTGDKVKIDDPNYDTTGLINTKPPSNLKKPKHNGTDWVEDGLIYKDTLVETAEDVWGVNRGILESTYDGYNARIAGIENPTSARWITFKSAYDQLVIDADAFITANGL